MSAAPSFGTAEPATTPEPLGPPTIAPCPSPKPLRVTGATLGLLMSYDGDGIGSEVLVPAWFFSIEGSASPTAEIAVDPSFLEQPQPQPQPLASGWTGSGSGVGGSPMPPTPPNAVASDVAPPTAGSGTGASASAGVLVPPANPPGAKPVG